MIENFEQSLIENNLKKLTTGSILLARDALKDPNFDSTVVLVCVHSIEGSYGLVLNRPSHMPLSEIFDGFQDSRLKREVLIGGPVSQEELQVLQITENPVEGAFAVAPRVYLGGKWEGIGHMIEADPEKTFLFLGYSGWGRGQLESEITVGAWDVYNINIEKLLLEGTSKLMVDSKQLIYYLEKFQN
ncbi:MAG: YqgE/AlgH family protein [Fibrobacter sp.]|jgi:putative transcriptional regulator|nr:YqgE/AlgH family protein [Fibrobacter sp.]